MKKKWLFLVLLIALSFALFSCQSLDNDTEYVQEKTIVLAQEYITLAEEYIEIEDYEKALDMYIKAKETNTIFEEQIRYDIARTAALAKKWSLAIEEYNALLELDSENLTIKKSLSWIYAQSGNLQEAQKLYAALYEQYSFDTHIATNYILVLHANKQTELAKTIFTSYSQMYPDAENLESLNDTLENEIID